MTEPPSERTPRIVSRRLLARGSRFDFDEVTVAGPDGAERTRQYVRHPGAVCVIPIRRGDSGLRIVMVRNYRAAIDAWLLELPAGTLEPGESPDACGARELAEETGYRASVLKPLGRFHTSPGLSDELMWLFAAEGLEFVGQHLDDGETLDVEELPLADAITLARKGGLTDGKSILGLLLAQDLGVFGEPRD